MMGSYPERPGEAFAIRYPTLINGILDRLMPCDSLDEAKRLHREWAIRSVESQIVHRVIPEWTDFEEAL